MRTIIIAAVIAILAGIIYQKVVKENMEVKEIVDQTKDIVSGAANKVNEVIGDESSRKEAVDNALNNVEEFSNTVSEKVKEEALKKGKYVAESIIAENINTDQNITCDIAKATVQKIAGDEMLTTKEEKYIDGLYKTMRNTSDISKEAAFSTIELIYCGNN